LRSFRVQLKKNVAEAAEIISRALKLFTIRNFLNEIFILNTGNFDPNVKSQSQKFKDEKSQYQLDQIQTTK